MTKFFKNNKLTAGVSFFLIVLILSVSVAFLLKSGVKDQKIASAETEPKEMVQKPSAFKEVAKPMYFPPLKISFRQKTLSVEEISVESDGKMGVPKEWGNAGWYAKGAKAGEEGNVIIDGHFDDSSGAPAAFWELKDLQIGDKVTLTDKLGRDFEYLITGKSYISITDPERAKVFESRKNKALTLITCGGVWDYASGTYNKRLVITAIFDKMEKS